jgi:putative endonuclease
MGQDRKNERGLYTDATVPSYPLSPPSFPLSPPSFPRKRESILSVQPGSLLHCATSGAYQALGPTMPPQSFRGARVEKSSYVYILASGLNGTLYVGVTSDLIKRIWQHREGLAEGFTKRYGIKDLVWYEIHSDITEAIRREKQIKKWDRAWKVELIQKTNPGWRDLYADITT